MKLKKNLLRAAGTFVLASTIFFACQKDVKQGSVSNSDALNAGKKTALDALTLSCGTSSQTSINIVVKAGASGAPAGFSIQWMTAEDFAKYGWPKGDASDDQTSTAPSFCKASLSGVPGCAQQYKLGANGSVTVNIGDNLFDNCGASSTCANTPLECGTDYVFRAFAHNDPASGLGKSAFSKDQTCATLPCTGGSEGCTYTQGYWKTHGYSPTGNNSNVWPVDNLTLGTVSYTQAQLQSIFDTPAGGNGLISLAHQLIAAKFNIANGASDAAIASAIADADALIGALVVPPVGSGSLSPADASSLIEALTNFNEGTTGPGHCN